MDIKNKIAEILLEIPVNALRWERGEEDLIEEFEWADKVLALEVAGHWCDHYNKRCMYQLCSRSHDWLSCDAVRPATIKDLIT